MIVLYVLGYFIRNKQNSYAALSLLLMFKKRHDIIFLKPQFLKGHKLRVELYIRKFYVLCLLGSNG